MTKYYTRACNFFYGSNSKKLVKKRFTLPLCGDRSISFDQIEIFSRENNKINSKIINIKNIHKLPLEEKKKISKDLKKITSKRKLLRKIAAALSRIEDGSYGFCEETGEEIGLRRLEARPIATLCFEAQERHEITEQHYSDMDD